MISLRHRATETELMDDLNCHGEVVDRTLRELDTINRLLGGNHVTVDGISKLVDRNGATKLSVADVGCGSGDMASRIARWSRQKGIDVSVLGIDANPNIIRFARENCTDTERVSFEVMDVLSNEYSDRKFDIVVATLFTHHFTDEQLVDLFQKMKRQTRLGFVINDIHRHVVAYHSIRILTRMFSRSPMVQNDGPLSVRRAFTRDELRRILDQAGIQHYSISWRWAFRWQVIVSNQ